MVAKPPLPDDYELPTTVNGWVHDQDSNRNGHVWTGADAERSVAVFLGSTTSVRVAVFDDRVDGFRNMIEPVQDAVPGAESEEEATVHGIDRAVEWMERHDPDKWDHPHVVEAVFDPPVGFVLDRYYLEEREHVVCYRQEGEESDVSLSGRPPDTEPSLDTRKYLYVEAWRGSGNATISLAPWLRASDGAKHEVVDAPEECGLEVALKLAREWVAEQTGESRDELPAGQSDLGAWS